MARLRHRDKWLSQAQALNAGLSVRKAALNMDVHRTTAFRWRHRFLALPAEQKAQSLQGIAEADETYELHSFKGQRRQLLAVQRAPRRRGGKATKRGLSAEQVPILVLRDRSGSTTDFVLKRRDKAAVQELLPQALAKDAVLCSDGSGLLAHAAMGLGFEHQGVNLSKGVRIRGAWHIQNVNAYHSRWKQWMDRFKGVATSYLENYLGWFRALDRNAQTGAKPASFLNIAVGVGGGVVHRLVEAGRIQLGEGGLRAVERAVEGRRVSGAHGSGDRLEREEEDHGLMLPAPRAQGQGPGKAYGSDHVFGWVLS